MDNGNGVVFPRTEVVSVRKGIVKLLCVPMVCCGLQICRAIASDEVKCIFFLLFMRVLKSVRLGIATYSMYLSITR